jgi:hypothetical protein
MLLVVRSIFLKMWYLTRACIRSANLTLMLAHVFGLKFYFFHPNTNLYLSLVMVCKRLDDTSIFPGSGPH